MPRCFAAFPRWYGSSIAPARRWGSSPASDERWSRRSWRRRGCGPYFDVVIGFEDITPPKPAPDPLIAAIARLGLKKANTVYVGDSMVDLETGRAARVKTVLAAWGLTPDLRETFRHHRLWATRPAEMLALVLNHPPDGKAA